MKVIGLTGGMGSGKSTLRDWFTSHGVPCFDSDAVGKELLNSELKSQIIHEFGTNIYSEKGVLDRVKLAQIVFNEPKALEKLNGIVHPAVARAFETFKLENNSASFVIKEAAILFESGAYKNCDEVILVCAPMTKRIERIRKRDQSTEVEIESRMQHQWTDAKKEELSDYVIQNEYLDIAYEQAEKIRMILMRKV